MYADMQVDGREIYVRCAIDPTSLPQSTSALQESAQYSVAGSHITLPVILALNTWRVICEEAESAREGSLRH